MVFRQTGRTLTDRQERALDRTIEQIRAQRRSRFRILACIKSEEDGYNMVRMAARLAPNDDCDIVVVYVRPIDQGLWSGGLQLRLARQNMLEAGLQLPGLRRLKQALGVLADEGIEVDDWTRLTGHEEAWNDPAGDNKVEFRSETGRSIVLKLKTAPDPAAGILDQYELGPYNLILTGSPSSWKNGFSHWFGTGVVQRVSLLAPCSVMIVRDTLDKKGFFITTDGSARAMQALRRSAILGYVSRQPITLFSAAPTEADRKKAEANVKAARELLKSQGVPVRKGFVDVGDPTDLIVKHGNAHKVIVVSHDFTSSILRMFKRSVSMEVMRRAETSVLDVR